MIFQVQSCVTSVEYDEHLGCPLTSKTDENVDWDKELFRNRRITMYEIAGMLRISFGSIQSIMKDNPNMHYAAIFKPHLPSD